MIQYSKETDERREAGPLECWCLHGAVGMAADWRGFAKLTAAHGIGTRAVDLWRFLQCDPMSLPEFGKALNADALGQVFRGNGRALLGYSMGARLALHALLAGDHPWQAAVIVAADPGLENDADKISRRTQDTAWATRALAGEWQEFLAAWSAQPVLAGAPLRDPQASAGLVMRRREIARSFVDWSLGAQEPLWDRLSKIQIPVLWIVGENDTKFRTLGERAVSQIPRGELLVAPGAGHRVPWDAPEWFAEKVSSFLKLGHA
ncbi:MAG: alpha/beta fold hydrolase [Verrucomicrobiota bacterium]